VDEQQQLEGVCMELEAANSKKLQAALSDSQINDAKVSPTSARYPVNNWRKFD